MKRDKKLVYSLMIVFSLFLNSVNIFPQSNDKNTVNVEGKWLGTLNVSAIQYRIVFNINKSEDGNLKATLDSPDQGAKDIPIEKVTLDKNKIKLVVTLIKGEYNGIVYPDSDKIEGTWSQGGMNFPLNLEKTKQEIAVNRPQEPKEPFPYNSEEVSYENKKAGITLAGTFTSPKEEGPFPAVLLITGSGAQNRNEELLGHKPFLVLADYLTKLGIAVLRVDDRGIGQSTGNFQTATSLDFADDALAGVEYLKSRKDVDKNKIGLIGHSEGGLIAPIVADESKDVAFIVLMAGPGIPGDQLLLKQSALIMKASGRSDSSIARAQKISAKVFNIIKTEKDSAKAYSMIYSLLNNYYDKLTPSEKKEIGDKETYLKQIDVALEPWFRFFINYDPEPALEKVKCPVLAINGEKDLQVPPKEDLEAIDAALKKGGNKNYRTVQLPGLNHLFQTSKTGSPSEYSKIEETIAPIALKTIGDWILKVTK